MNNELKRLIEKVVEKMAEESSEAGVTLNQDMKAKKFKKIKNQVIANELTEKQMIEYLNEPAFRMPEPVKTKPPKR